MFFYSQLNLNAVTGVSVLTYRLGLIDCLDDFVTVCLIKVY